MAIFHVIEGAPGQGKSLSTARIVRELLRRNKKWHEKNGTPLRKIASNIKFSKQLEEEYPGQIVYWTDTTEICKMHDVDLIWDEIATELDSRNFANLTSELKRFLSQYRKRGVDIYANTQDFSMIDARARLMITGVETLTKLMGSRDLSATKPDPKFVWGVIVSRTVENYREISPEKKKYSIFPSFFFIEKQLTDMYDTKQDIPQGALPPLKHVVQYCEYHGIGGEHVCDFKKVSHI